MLANIKYAMRKDKSAPITMRGLNLSSMINDGDVVDSKNVSLRKYPYITTGKQDKVEIEDGNVKSMTVFMNDLVTKDEEMQFATINTRLAMFPSRTYQHQNGQVNDLGATIEGRLWFSNNSILAKTTVQNQNIYQGYGISVSEKAIAFPRPSRLNKSGCGYCIGKTGDLRSLLGVVNYENAIDTAHWEILEDYLVFNGTPATVGISVGDVFYLSCPEGYEDYSNFYEVSGITEYTSSTPPYFIVRIQRYGEQNKSVVFSMGSGVNLKAYKITSDDLPGAGGRMLSAGGKEFVITEKSNDGKNIYYISPQGEDIPKGIYDYVSILGWGGGIPPILEGETITLIAPTVGKIISGIVSGSIWDTITLETPANPFSVSLTEKVYAIRGSVESFDNGAIKSGDVVEISNCKIDDKDANNTFFKIDRIEEGVVYSTSDIFTPGLSDGAVTIERKIPALDFICEKDNRLYGCSNADNTIYVSALGDPTNMFDYDGISTDSFAVAVGSDGDFTGCCKYGSSVLFFKENKIYKLMGSYPAEYSLYSYDVDGVEAGSENSIVTINEVLYYKAKRGIFAYTGDVPSLISASFGEKRFHSAAAGTDGESYYVSMKDENGQSYLFSYNTRLGIWMMEGNDDISQFVRHGNDVKALSHGNVYNFRSVEDTNVEWHLQFAPIYETMEGKKIYSRIMMRAEIPRGSYMKIKIRCDGGAWLEAGTVVGKMADVVPIMIPINRCDKFELRLEGKGPCTILSMQREFYVSGSNK